MIGSRVLVVEDEFLIRLTLAEALADEGFEVVEAESADQALAMLTAGERVDLLLTDVQVPGKLNGLELARQARALHPGLPVIYMTGRPDAMQGLAGSGRDVFIAKPYLPSAVCAAARKLLDAPPPPA